MTTQKLLGATFLIAVSLATIGETRGGLPPPRRYAAVVLLWFIFGLAAELGGQVARFTGVLAALVTLAMGMGTAGRRALGWLSEQAALLQTQPVSEAELAGGGSAWIVPPPLSAGAAAPGRPR